MYPNPSLHPSPSTNAPSGYPSADDFARRQHHLPADGYVPAQHQQDQREHSTTCVPSLCPPGMDPSQVDVRSFFPYQPNEVKHRKRTTRQQLKILEEVYSYDTKPNSTLRKKMADELNMTPRGVQVWFQNRRAKEKNLARKAELALEGGAAKKPIDLGASSSAAASPADVAPSSSPTPVPSNPSSSTESSAPSSSLGPPDATATPPERTSPSPPSSSPSTAPPVPRIDTSDAPSADASPFLPSASHSPPEPEEPATGYLRPNAELLAQRRTSLPILSLTPSPRALVPRASIHGAAGGMLSVSHAQPAGFDPMLRRRSVDTNIKRLKAHPYAHLARGTNERFHPASPAHLHSLPSLDGPGRLDAIPGGLGGPRMGLGLRHGSMPHVLQSPLPEFTPAFEIPPHHNHRPTLSQKHSMPTLHEPPSREFRPARTISTGHLGAPLFTNPNPFGASLAPPPFEYDTAPVSPLAGMPPPASPSSASPPPISHYSVHAPLRFVGPPVPGPLPEPSFSFGEPSAPSSAASSPPSDHSTVVDMRRGSGDSLPEDDTSAGGSSVYDPLSRFGSFASVDSQSSWTSCQSEVEEKEIEGFDPARRGSFASYALPELLGGLDVTDGAPPPPEHTADNAPTHEQQAYAPYHDKQEYPPQGAYDPTAFAPHALVYPASGQDPFAPQQDMYAMDKSGYCEPHASSSELAYALQPSGSMNGQTHSYGMGYAGDGNAHAPSADAAEYASLDTSYEHGYAPEQTHSPYDQVPTHYSYSMYAGTPMYASGAVELDSMCVPANMTMDGMNVGDYTHQYS